MAYLRFQKPTPATIYNLPTWKKGMSLDDNIIAESIDTTRTTSFRNRNTFGWAMDAHIYLSELQLLDNSETQEALYNNLVLPIFAEGDVFGNWDHDKRKNIYVSQRTYRDAITVIEDITNAYQKLVRYRSDQAKGQLDNRIFADLSQWLMWSYGVADVPSRLTSLVRDDFRHHLQPLDLRMAGGIPAGNDGMEFHTETLIGWCWFLIMRDFMEEITYLPCEAWDCNRSVPNIGLPTARLKRGRAMSYCGNRCRSANSNKKNRNLRLENEDLKTQLTELKGKLNAKNK